MTLRQREPRIEDAAHLKFIRLQPCCIPYCKRQAEAAHIRFACLEIDKRETGRGERPSDCYATPLCPYHHRIGIDSQHASNEAAWWARTGLNPFEIAARLWIESGGATRAAERVQNPKPVKPRKIKLRNRTAPKREIPGRALQSRSTFPPGRKLTGRGFEKRTPV